MITHIEPITVDGGNAFIFKAWAIASEMLV